MNPIRPILVKFPLFRIVGLGGHQPTIALTHQKSKISLSIESQSFKIDNFVLRQVKFRREYEVIFKEFYAVLTQINILKPNVFNFLLVNERNSMNINDFLNERGYSKEFNYAIKTELDEIPDLIPEEEINSRVSLFDKIIITIDGEDAKDLDDAVSLEKLKNGNYLLGVHIADVSHYVKEGSAIDDEAFERGTSVYLVDTVIPMLPQKLSNGLCSLLPHRPRLTLSCFM